MDLALLNIIVMMAVSFFLLYQRRKKWLTNKLRWIIVVSVAIIGIVGLLLTRQGREGTGTPLFQLLFIPVLHNGIDRAFKLWSMRLQGRDFYLYLRGSNDIDDRMNAENPHISGADMAFSICLLLITMALIVISIALFRVY
jgi:hypothetical protein